MPTTTVPAQHALRFALMVAAALALTGAGAPSAQPSPTLDETVAYILRQCDGHVQNSYDRGKLAATVTTRMRIEGDTIVTNVTLRSHVSDPRWRLRPYTKNWAGRFDVNNVRLHKGPRDGGYGPSIDASCIRNIVANEGGCISTGSGRAKETWFQCRNQGNTLRALLHFQQLRGGELKPDDPFAAR